jgi:hypothetical protein
MAGGALSDGVPGTAVRPGRDVVSLAAGEPDTDTPAHITAAAAAISGEHHYGPAAGSTGLRTAVATQLATLAPPFTADDVQICMGTKHALYGFVKRVAGRQIGPDAPVGLSSLFSALGRADQPQDALIGHPAAHLLHQQSVMDRSEAVLDVGRGVERRTPLEDRLERRSATRRRGYSCPAGLAA